MTKIIETQFPYIDHNECVANIGIATFREKDFMIVLNKRETQQFLCIINHSQKTLLNFGDKKIEIPHGVSCIRLQDLMSGDTELNFRFEEDAECEYFTIGRWVGGCN